MKEVMQSLNLFYLLIFQNETTICFYMYMLACALKLELSWCLSWCLCTIVSISLLIVCINSHMHNTHCVFYSQRSGSVVLHPPREAVSGLYCHCAPLPCDILLDLQLSPTSCALLVARQCRLHCLDGCNWGVPVHADWAEGYSSQQWTQI